MAHQQQHAPPVFSVEEEAGRWGGATAEPDREGETWTERENGTVFVVPTTPQAAEGRPRWEYLKGGDQDGTSLAWMSEDGVPDGDTTTLGSSSEDTLSRDLERVSLGSLGKWTWDIHSIIIDLSTANFIDTVAIKTIRNVCVGPQSRSTAWRSPRFCRFTVSLSGCCWQIFQDFREIDVDVFLAGCPGE